MPRVTRREAGGGLSPDELSALADDLDAAMPDATRAIAEGAAPEESSSLNASPAPPSDPAADQGTAMQPPDVPAPGPR